MQRTSEGDGRTWTDADSGEPRQAPGPGDITTIAGPDTVTAAAVEVKGFEWVARTPEGWRNVVEGWQWREWKEGDTRLGWRKWGPCPRCGDTMAVYQEAVRTFSALDTVAARCNCRSDHANRPEGVEGGCGAGFGGQVRIPAKQVAP